MGIHQIKVNALMSGPRERTITNLKRLEVIRDLENGADWPGIKVNEEKNDVHANNMTRSLRTSTKEIRKCWMPKQIKREKERRRKSSRHHHESCTALLHAWSVAARSQVVLLWICSTSRVSVAVLLSSNFVVIIAQYNATSRASEASRMELAASIDFQILAFDAAVAATADGPVELMVMTLAVGRVVEDVELGCWERIAAGSACEALFVVSSSDATRRVLDRFPYDWL
jgi:hypothetical protein